MRHRGANGSPEQTTVLIGFAEALAAPEAAWSLLDAGHRVMAFARRGRACGLRRDRRVEIVEITPPELSFSAAVAALEQLLARVDVVMPLDDPSVLLVATAHERSRFGVAGPVGALAELALDKTAQLSLAARAGLPVPPWEPVDLAEVAGTTLPLPCFVKPALAAEVRDDRLLRLSPRRITRVEDLERVTEEWGADTRAFRQQIVYGTGQGVFGLAAGDGLRLSAHRRIRMMNPAGSGASACESQPVPPELVERVERFIALGGWTGVFMLEFLNDEAGTSWFMELNGRPWGSLALTRRCGFEYPAWAVARALDPNAPLPDAPPFASVTCRHLGREVAHLAFVVRGPSHGDDAQWPSRGATLRHLLASPRRSRWYNWSPKAPRVLASDTWCTVRSLIGGRT